MNIFPYIAIALIVLAIALVIFDFLRGLGNPDPFPPDDDGRRDIG